MKALALCLCFVLGALPAPALHAQAIETVSPEGLTYMMRDAERTRTGAASPTLTIIEFMDYRCPYCKQFQPTLASVLASDGHLAVVYKDWAILGAVSQYAARAALAAAWQQRYVVAHDALMQAKALTGNERVDEVLSQAGIDVKQLQADLRQHASEIDAQLQRNDSAAKALGLRGTPGIIVGDQLLPGIVSAADLQKLVADARARLGTGIAAHP